MTYMPGSQMIGWWRPLPSQHSWGGFWRVLVRMFLPSLILCVWYPWAWFTRYSFNISLWKTHIVVSCLPLGVSCLLLCISWVVLDRWGLSHAHGAEALCLCVYKGCLKAVIYSKGQPNKHCFLEDGVTWGRGSQHMQMDYSESHWTSAWSIGTLSSAICCWWTDGYWLMADSLLMGTKMSKETCWLW